MNLFQQPQWVYEYLCSLGSPHNFSWLALLPATLTYRLIDHISISFSLPLHTCYHSPLLKFGNFDFDLSYLFVLETICFHFLRLGISVVNLGFLLESRVTLPRVECKWVIWLILKAEPEILVKLRSWPLSVLWNNLSLLHSQNRRTSTLIFYRMRILKSWKIISHFYQLPVYSFVL